ncbi:dGTPase [Marinomonas mediterranea]|uniref:Probable deoxyguanosinetriphosphate triphosphohydrolase n=1 Tax=Marinomonas mediterranea (strain ATCC 700492 / JCM 21426 / NBRC 103028 / MMB-1) TaxID=717774 RepID=F2K429_MARM1|nr:dGTPase [Marinomonas mediterranea]ADZ91371.1 deoxyguanosinetriphosphate triphosphohydrolase [Marinomonas mediterranea MMB-1]WCN17489.1 dGTPase [Marinomonas mediterranea MMB-1]
MTINFNRKVRGTRVYHNNATVSPRPLEDLNEIAAQGSFESDRGRILNSAAIRRLQQKTQVFPLERNAAVRSRLTHSLEVQQVGRYITQLIFQTLPDTDLNKYKLAGLERQIESIVEMSCLMHDVGNPPFGHFGEQAINDWFSRHLVSLVMDNQGNPRIDLPAPILQDLTNFEGNAQAIRLVHTILGLNLTYSQVSGIVKYTRRGDQASPKKQPNSSQFKRYDYLMKKVGYYLSEHRYVESLKTALSMDSHCRSPFSYIMEAADDISYGIADIEDAVEKGIITIEQLERALVTEFKSVIEEYGLAETSTMQKIVNAANSSASKANNCADSHFFVTLRVEVNKCLPQHACKQFIDNIEDVFHGTFNRALIEDKSENHALVSTLKNIAKNYAFCDPEVEKSELQGYRIITGLLEAYKPLLMLDRNTFTNIESAPLYEKRLYKKLPNKHLRAYEIAMQTLEKEKNKVPNTAYLPYEFDHEIWEFYFRVRLIQDYISGMTDQYAFDEYRALNVLD